MKDEHQATYYRAVGQRIKRARLDQNLTQADLCLALGWTQASYWRLETGETEIRLHQVVIIAQRLNIDIRDLIFGLQALKERA